MSRSFTHLNTAKQFNQSTVLLTDTKKYSTMYSKYVKIIAILFSFFVLPVGAQPGIVQASPDKTAEKILEGLHIMEYSYPGQKVFIHTDKEEYLAGETVWLKAYVVNATTHRPDTLSTNLYVELFNVRGDLASILLMRLENGYTHGDIFLPDSLSEGSYRLKAYTDWMHNFDEDLFFSKDIHVVNPIEENFIKRLDVLRNRWFNRGLEKAQERLQFAFFPEGGYLISGLENHVAFKAANEPGAGIDASGVLYDGHGTEVLQFSTFHDGMGSFSFIPQEGMQYTAEVTFENGVQERFSMPRAQLAGYLLSAQKTEDHVMARVATSEAPDALGLAEEFYVLAQSRGRPVFLEKGRLEDNTYSAMIPLQDIPNGITQIKLFTIEGEPIAERLVFHNKGDIHTPRVTDLHAGNSGDEERLFLSLSFSNGDLEGSYSLAVLDTDEATTNYRANIATEYLLSGEIAAALKDPWYYLLEKSPEASRAADLVMMTHGWRRFDWQNIVDRDFPEIKYGFPKGISLSGVVSPRSSERETGETEVELAVEKDKVDIYTTTTTRQGEFVFSNLDYDGRFTATLRINQPVHQRALRADLNVRETEDITYENNFNTRFFEVTSRGDDWERTSRPETMFRSRGLVEPSRETLSMYRDADQVIYFDDIRDQHSSVMDVLRSRVRGLRVIGDEIVLRGRSSFRMSNEPVFLVDEVIVNRTTFLSTSIYEVERMAVISGPSSAILGSRGANGALLIYTLRGDDHRHDAYQYMLKGFHVPSETFDAKIHTDHYTQYNISRTLYWEPRLTTDENGDVNIGFPAGDPQRSMRVVVQGIDGNGRITFKELFIDDTEI